MSDICKADHLICKIRWIFSTAAATGMPSPVRCLTRAVYAYSALQCLTVPYSALQCLTVPYSALQCIVAKNFSKKLILGLDICLALCYLIGVPLDTGHGPTPARATRLASGATGNQSRRARGLYIDKYIRATQAGAWYIAPAPASAVPSLL